MKTIIEETGSIGSQPVNIEKKVLSGIDWEQRRFELVKIAMQGLLSTCIPGLLDKNLLAALSIDYADTILKEYRKGDKL